MSRAVEAEEVSGGRRRIVRGLLRDLPPPEVGALRPLARTLVDLAIALTDASDYGNDEEPQGGREK